MSLLFDDRGLSVRPTAIHVDFETTTRKAVGLGLTDIRTECCRFERDCG